MIEINYFASALYNNLIEALLLIAAFFFVGKAVIFLIDRVVRKLTEKTETQLDDMILAVVEKPAFYLIMIWGVYAAMHRLSEQFNDSVFKVADRVTFILAVLVIVKVVYDVVNAMLDWYGMTAAEKGQEGISKSILPLTKKLVKLFAFISGLIVILDHFNYNISSLVAALGVSSLAIGLAAKETLSNMISGFAIVADKPFRIGDRIETENRVGDVIEIGLRSTKIRTLDNNVVVIPNAKLVDNSLINYDYPEGSQVGTIKVGVVQGCDIEQVKGILVDAALSSPAVVTDPAPFVLFLDQAESNFFFTLIFTLKDHKQKGTALDLINTAIANGFKKSGISYSVPQKKILMQTVGASAGQE